MGHFGRLDILVCNAGITGRPGPFATIDMDDYDRVMAINLRSQFRLCNRALLIAPQRGAARQSSLPAYRACAAMARSTPMR